MEEKKRVIIAKTKLKKIPKHCYQCDFRISNGDCYDDGGWITKAHCIFNGKNNLIKGKLPDCPLKEIDEISKYGIEVEER